MDFQFRLAPKYSLTVALVSLICKVNNSHVHIQITLGPKIFRAASFLALERSVKVAVG